VGQGWERERHEKGKGGGGRLGRGEGEGHGRVSGRGGHGVELAKEGEWGEGIDGSDGVGEKKAAGLWVSQIGRACLQ
jgi:hypothetical protein